MSESLTSKTELDATNASNAPDQWLAPIKPHDALPFERLSSEYNLLNISSYGRVLTNLVVEELRNRGGRCRALDIGCGYGIGREVGYQWAIRQHTGELWGIEPDESVRTTAGLFDHFQHASMETAVLPAATFDVAYSSMVMEHVGAPGGFLASLRQSLRPGGVYLFATPNARSLVPWLTKVCHQLGIDELALRLLRGKQAEEYHYPVKFLCNTPQQIEAWSQATGFAPPEYVFIEGTGSYSYFRGPLRIFRAPLLAKRRWIRRSDRLATLICKLRRPESA